MAAADIMPAAADIMPADEVIHMIANRDFKPIIELFERRLVGNPLDMQQFLSMLVMTVYSDMNLHNSALILLKAVRNAGHDVDDNLNQFAYKMFWQAEQCDYFLLACQLGGDPNCISLEEFWQVVNGNQDGKNMKMIWFILRSGSQVYKEVDPADASGERTFLKVLRTQIPNEEYQKVVRHPGLF